jgi:hypothetical protein
MVTFDHRKAAQGREFELEQKRLEALLADMEKIRSGADPEHMCGDAPILDHWVLARRPALCLAGLSSGHPRLRGEARPIITSDLRLLSEDRHWGRTLSRWYQLGRPARGGHGGS